MKEAISMVRKPDRITKIIVKGFKSIYEKQEIDILPLTLLAGANSSGKSSIMQPVLLLKQTIEAPSDPGALLIDGPNVRFTQAEQLLSRKISGRDPRTEFSVGLELNTGAKLEVTFKREKTVGFNISSMLYSSDKEQMKITPEMTHDEITKLFPFPYRELSHYLDKEGKKERQFYVYRDRCFLSFELRSVSGEQRYPFFAPNDVFPPSSIFISHLEGLIHLPGLRGNPRRTYPNSAAGPLFPGTFENYVASVISHWQTKYHDRLKELGLALEDMGLTWKVKADPVADTQVGLKVGRLSHGKQGGASDLVSIADVGFGVSQSLPVLVALLVAKEGQVVYLEQPEIHLHPRAQRKLAHILKHAVERGVIAIVETHSALLLKEIQVLVASGKLDKNLIKLHWFQRQEDGETIIKSAELDDHGAYGDWPEDFGEVELDAEKSYLDAVELREGIR